MLLKKPRTALIYEKDDINHLLVGEDSSSIIGTMTNATRRQKAVLGKLRQLMDRVR
jgi:hypothetical protein